MLGCDTAGADCQNGYLAYFAIDRGNALGAFDQANGTIWFLEPPSGGVRGLC